MSKLARFLTVKRDRDQHLIRLSQYLCCRVQRHWCKWPVTGDGRVIDGDIIPYLLKPPILVLNQDLYRFAGVNE